jgi:FKBP-type peptidyl-prolyl cis-trans isomerase SlyD
MDVSDDCVVTIAYELTDGEGVDIEAVAEEDGLSYLHGHGNIVPGLEDALHGLSVGEGFETTVEPDRGYGEHADELVSWVDRDAFPGDTEPEPGMAFQASRSDAEGGEAQQILFVTEVTDEQVKVDANHPLAGKTLNFEGSVIDVREATDEEIEAGRPAEAE